MKAAVVPSANSRWAIQEVPTPEPGPGQVLIKIHASGLCYTDVHQTRGELPGPFPRTLGHEPVGEIVGVGSGVNTRRVGDRVGVPWIQTTCGRCEWCLRGRPMFCPEQIGTGAQMSGGHAEYMLAFADATMLLPEGISYEQAAPIFCAGYTVWSGLRWADPKPGERVASASAGSATSPFSTPRLPASKPWRCPIRQTRTGSFASSAPIRLSATARAWAGPAARISC